MLITTARTEVLNGFLFRWKGVILATYPPKSKGKPTRYLTRINPDLANSDDLEKLASASKYSPQARYRVSSNRGIGLLTAVSKEKGMAQAEKSSTRPEFEEHWVGYKDTVSPESMDRIRLISETLEINCGYLMRQQIQLLRQIVENGPNAQLAELQLAQQIPNDDCVPPPPTFALANPIVLPEVRAGSSFTFVLNPPATVARPFSANITSAQGSFTSQFPQGGTLYGGSVYLNTDGNQLALATQPTFVLPQCALSETFNIRLTDRNNVVSNYLVTLPVRLQIPGLGIQSYNLRPGVNVGITLCAAGDRTPMTWSWVPGSGDPFPPQGMTFSSTPSGNASLSGTPQVSSYVTHGTFRVQQGSKIANLGAQIVVNVGWSIIIGTACAQHRLTPGVAFSCEMPRPTGYASHTWSVGNGSLPVGASLLQRGSTWFVEGTVPFWSSQCPICSPFDTVGVYNVTFNLAVPGFNGVAATKDATFDVGIPFSVWSQNTILRPSGWPTIANTADDNAERAQMVLDRINAQTFDIISLQEVFDEEQRDQIALGYPTANYNLLWGPDEDDFEEESGVAVLVKGNPSTDFLLRQSDLEFLHHNEVYNECAGSDCWANKGFSVNAVRVGNGAAFSRVWIINTHLNAAYDFPDQHSAERHSQLTQIMNYLSQLGVTDEPVLLMGDLNIVAGSQEYMNRMSDVLSGWEDPIAAVFGNAAIPFTNDKTRSAYGHFWQNEHHIHEHLLEDYFLQNGQQACINFANAIGWQGLAGACTSPIPHPTEQSRIDYMLIRQGTTYQLVMDSALLEDNPRRTTLCRDSFQPQYTDPNHGSLLCYLSDHFGLSATLRLVRH